MKSRTAVLIEQNPNLFHLSHKIAAGALSVLLATTLMCPNIALAADYLFIDDKGYDWNTTGYSGNGWEWKEQDNLNLNGYEGSEIIAKGNLNIQVSGENTVTTSMKETSDSTDSKSNPETNGIEVKGGNLSISGDGKLSINADGDGICVNEGKLIIEDVNLSIALDSQNSKSESNGIEVTKGDLTINDATVDIQSVDKGLYDYGITTNGNIDINKSTVSIEGASKGIFATGLMVSEDIYKGGIISVKDSDIKVLLNKAAFDNGSVDVGTGIMAQTYGRSEPARISFDGSNVLIDANRAAIFALNADAVFADQINSFKSGIISIINSKIQAPEGARICDYYYEQLISLYSSDAEQYSVVKGQTIGLTNELITASSLDKICANVNIVADKPAVTPGAFDATGAYGTTTASTSLMPRTGDTSGIIAAFAGVACLTAGAFLVFTRSRKRQ